MIPAAEGVEYTFYKKVGTAAGTDVISETVVSTFNALHVIYLVDLPGMILFDTAYGGFVNPSMKSVYILVIGE